MKISIVGATGLVGRNIIELCEEYFDNSVEYHLYASKESEGKTLQVNGKEVPIRELSSKNIDPDNYHKSIKQNINKITF